MVVPTIDESILHHQQETKSPNTPVRTLELESEDKNATGSKVNKYTIELYARFSKVDEIEDFESRLIRGT